MTVRTVFVVDDHPLIRDGLETALAPCPDLRFGGYAATGAEALAQLPTANPDLVLLDLRLPDVLASELVGDILAVCPEARILLCTAFPEHRAVNAAIASGAHGLIVKDAQRADLVAAIRAVLAGEDAGFEPSESSGVLTAREYDVLRRIAMGHTNPEIGAELFLSRSTVKSYVQNVLHKLGVRNRVEAIAKARELGLL